MTPLSFYLAFDIITSLFLTDLYFIRNWQESRIRIWARQVIVSLLFSGALCGCDIPARFVLESFFSDCARKNLKQAGAFISPELRSSLTNAPFALEAFVYGSEFTWDVRDIIATCEGLVCLADVHVAWSWMFPKDMHALLVCSMRRNAENGRWYITAMDVKVQEFVELVPEPVAGSPMHVGGLLAPRWEIKQAVDESLIPFIRRLDQCCKTWKY